MKDFTNEELMRIIISLTGSRHSVITHRPEMLADNPQMADVITKTLDSLDSILFKLNAERTRRMLGDLVDQGPATCEHGNVPADCEECNPIFQPERNRHNDATGISDPLASGPAGGGQENPASRG